uniref:leucyl aminopeptidase n=1 Tax=Pararhizobium sp. IMCC3301 TaxID=3067904 RepID=UPI00274106E3|nr:leucyl aminopeptidase [Pararhizobium sp. IMCC3301]
MSHLTDITFQKKMTGSPKIVVTVCSDSLTLPATLVAYSAELKEFFRKAAAAAGFEGKSGSNLNLVLPAGTPFDRLIVVGLSPKKEETAPNWRNLGGQMSGLLSGDSASIVLDDVGAEDISSCAQGLYLRSYKFDKYKTRKDDEKSKSKAQKLTLVADAAADAKKLWQSDQAVADGTVFARDLVNEPANILTTSEFAERLKELKDLGVEVQVLDEKELAKIGMRALLGVGQGSAMPSKVVVMRWNGGKDKDQPLAFIGKGVVFDTGGISIKPAGGMEDMKGDMGGAAAVSGLMKALAGRKARANVVGVVGLVENMPDGMAQRPGDIVTSLSGQTIEIINTDAEGRLVLADLLWYVEDTFKPKFMINLATLTGAVIVALGNHHAGLFSNSDDLSAALHKAGNATEELVWRLPLGKPYDKLIDSKFADMKNTGGRWAGSITAAQFLQRFVRNVDWAHLDIAGTAMGSPDTEVSRSWGSGFGVRLLNQLVRDGYER